MKVGVIDLGTNTCRLFLAEVEDGRVATVERITVVVRLGQGVDASGALHPAAKARTVAKLGEYTPRLLAFGPARRLLIGTSVLRDARDGREFLATVERDLGLPWRLLSGEEEGGLAFRGGTASLAAPAVGSSPAGPAPAEPAPSVALVDIGGGSTEFCVGAPGAAPGVVRSLDIGAVRVTERCFRHDPPLPEELAAGQALIREAIRTGVPAAARAAATRLIGVAGTFLTLAAHKLELRDYRRELVDGQELSLADIDQAVALFARLTSAERGRRAGIQKGREDVILAGAMIAAEACRAFGLASVTCSEADILEGAALALADGSLVRSEPAQAAG
jgi:exopolyphosphatase / guanosine-5'-triphosphate,3'-diphosphate pyrophosphatase